MARRDLTERERNSERNRKSWRVVVGGRGSGGCIGNGRKRLGGLLESYYREIKGSNSSCDDFY